VRENRSSGWQAWRDGVPAPIQATDAWLPVPAPVGAHRYRFRYQPWDVPLGLLLTLLGVDTSGALSTNVSLRLSLAPLWPAWSSLV